jgi:predicted nucleic acid-binding protein
MPEVISNTGPLIALASIGQFDLLHKLFGTVHINRRPLRDFRSKHAERRHRGRLGGGLPMEPLVAGLRRAGFYMSDELYAQVLQSAGEGE